MKTIALITLFLCLSASFYGQEFSFTLRFEDAVGNKDSLILGYDPEATDGVDPAFGEEDLHYKPFHPEFEVRISDIYRYEFLSDTMMLKKQIEKKKCGEMERPMIQVIWIKCKHFPLKISWDPVFDSQCVEKTFIVDWDSGAWFDAVRGGEQGPFFFKENISISLSYINSFYFDYRGDPLQELYFMLASKDNFKTIVGLPEISGSKPRIYPNPVTDLLYIDDQVPGNEIQSIQLKDMAGRIVMESLQSPVSVAHLPKGFYLIEIKYNNLSKPIISKVIKN